jgi:hypothetical protein
MDSTVFPKSWASAAAWWRSRNLDIPYALAANLLIGTIGWWLEEGQKYDLDKVIVWTRKLMHSAFGELLSDWDGVTLSVTLREYKRRNMRRFAATIVDITLDLFVFPQYTYLQWTTYWCLHY